MDSNNIKLSNAAAAILVADTDFGRCAVASDLPRALWPVGDTTVLQQLVNQIIEDGIQKIVICSAFDPVKLAKSIQIPKNADIRFHQELFPRGTAGSIYDAWHIAGAELLFVFHAEMVSPPKLKTILHAHQQANADMTIAFNPSADEDRYPSESAQIYICCKSIIENIPQEGYCDIKETLIPRLVQNSKTIFAAEMPAWVGNFRNWKQYLKAVAAHIQCNHENTIAATAQIGDNVKIIRPVFIGQNAVVGPNTVIIGPAVISSGVKIDSDCIISESIIWNDSQIEKECCISKSLLKQHSYVSSASTVSETLLTHDLAGIYKFTNNLKSAVFELKNSMEEQMFWLKGIFTRSTRYLRSKASLNSTYFKWVTGLLIFIAFLWSYWSSVFTDLWQIWMQSDEYSSGLLVPLITAYIIWTRRKEIADCQISPSLWGLVLFASAQSFRFFGLVFMYDSAERISMLMTVAALILLLFGWKILGKLTTVLLFLALMIPLPNSIHTRLTMPLQNLATTSAVFFLEAFGFSVLREGNLINLAGVTVAVAEACNGLRMITSFFVISSMVALLVKRSLLQKIIIVLSSIPIALFCNTIRLTATSVAFTYLDSTKWEKVFHDFGGLAMMPVALAIVITELWILSNVFVSPELQKSDGIRKVN